MPSLALGAASPDRVAGTSGQACPPGKRQNTPPLTFPRCPLSSLIPNTKQAKPPAQTRSMLSKHRPEYRSPRRLRSKGGGVAEGSQTRPGSPRSSRSAPNPTLGQREHPPRGQEDDPFTKLPQPSEGRPEAALPLRAQLSTTANISQKMPFVHSSQHRFRKSFIIEVTIPFMFFKPVLEGREFHILLSHLILRLHWEAEPWPWALPLPASAHHLSPQGPPHVSAEAQPPALDRWKSDNRRGGEAGPQVWALGMEYSPQGKVRDGQGQ